VNEGLEEPKIAEPTVQEHGDVTLDESPSAAPTAERPAAAPETNWLRWAYSLEFLIAIVAVISLWGEIGGEGHLELIPWYIKLACILGWSWSCVGLTAAMVGQKKVWNARTIRWLLGIILLTAAMGGITYYYHLHEEPDDGGDDTTADSVTTLAPGHCLYVACNRQST